MNQPSAANRSDRSDNRQGRRDNAQGNRSDRTDNRQGRRDDAQGNRQDRRQGHAESRPDRIENRQEWQNNRGERRDQVRDQVRENHPRLDFWSDHPNWARRRVNRPYRAATWGALAGWAGYGASAEPVGYDYGEDVYYEDDSVYYGDEEVASAEEYAQQAEEIATSAPEVDEANAEWLPLGVFALTQDGQASGAEPTMFLQLMISKEGVIAGNFNNSATDTSTEITGMIDKKSQRAAWTAKGKTRPLIETGLQNLTEDSAPALVHFEDGQTQQWLMVRLEDPAGEQE